MDLSLVWRTYFDLIVVHVILKIRGGTDLCLHEFEARVLPTHLLVFGPVMNLSLG